METNWGTLIKEIGRGAHGARALGEENAYRMFAAMLDGAVPELELGGIMIALRIKGESVAELRGFQRAAAERMQHLVAPAGAPRPVVLPSYNGARRQPNLLPLLALLLARAGCPVLIHGVLDDFGRVTSTAILHELGIEPSASAAEAKAALAAGRVAFLADELLAPGLARLLALRKRLGVRGSAHTLAKLLDPFAGRGLRVVSVTHPDYQVRMRDYFAATGEDALLMRGSEGEPFANPRRQPQIELLRGGKSSVLVEQVESDAPMLPAAIDAKTTAEWIREALAGAQPVPEPLVQQLACCFYAAGRAEDFNQALAFARELVRPIAQAH
ncbi:MAG: DNA-binding protein YbiB [Betaproteobacteria bacterium]|nr:DNA-binding protein YbiB [Betaproteobacteria bacterium]